MPTALERTGNFSQSVNGAGALIVVSDPMALNSAGAATPFPGNIVPQSRINGWGQAMLNFFPLPNTGFAQGTAQYLQDNFQSAGSAAHPRRNDIVRMDFNITSKLNAYLRWGHDADDWTELYQSSQFLIGPHRQPYSGSPGAGSRYFGLRQLCVQPDLGQSIHLQQDPQSLVLV